MHLGLHLLTPSAPSAAITMSAVPSAVLFDIDGTLFDSDVLHYDVFRQVLVEEGFNDGTPITERFFREKISGRSNIDICADLFPLKSAPEAAAFSALKERRFRALAECRLSSLITPGLEALLEWISAAGVASAAVTNAPRANAELMLRAIGRLEWFDALVIGEECEHAKPHPEPYLVAMRRLGVEPSRCVALEDSPSGARAAVAAGVRTIGVLSSQPASVLAAEGCEVLVKDFRDAQLWDALGVPPP
ncbi:hypothetical protein AB1Y20_016977 [Prymnesium parvum]|uniref:Uncharacterized protein n=1 Tax=Prymnesium parvum TaxID=97485 RepID=A0AB34IBZ3_PRYPA